MCGEESYLATIQDSNSSETDCINTSSYKNVLLHSDPFINAYAEINGTDSDFDEECFDDTEKHVVDSNLTDGVQDFSPFLPASSLDEYSSLFFNSDNDLDISETLLRGKNLFRSEISHFGIQEPISVKHTTKYMPSNKNCTAFEQLLQSTEASSVAPHPLYEQEITKSKDLLSTAEHKLSKKSNGVSMGLENTWNDDRRVTLSPVSNYALPMPPPPTISTDLTDLNCSDRLVGPANESYTSNLDTFFSSHEVETDITDATAEPGACGLRNLGNTCYMGAGIQCLVATEALLCYFLKESVVNTSEVNLTYQFTELVQKMWSGQYSVAYPLKFKQAFGELYPQFKENVQHDCHEFLTLLMDKLHQQLLLRIEDKQFDDENMLKGIYNLIQKKKQETESMVIPIDDFYGPANSNDISMDSASDNNDSLPSNVRVESKQNENDNDEAACQELLIQMSEGFNSASSDRCPEDDRNFKDAGVDCDIYVATSDPLIETIPSNDGGNIAVDNEFITGNTGNASNDSVCSSRSTASTNLNLEEVIINENELEVNYQNGLNSDNDDDDDSIHMYANNANGKRWKTTKTIVTSSKSASTAMANTCDGFVLKKFKMNDFIADGQEQAEKNDCQETKIASDVKVENFLKKEIFNNISTDNKIDSDHSDVDAESKTQKEETDNVNRQVDAQINGVLKTEDKESSSPLNDNISMEVGDGLNAANKWKNRSVILDSFQGQFQNTVRCTVCDFESISYEPFVFVPVSLPDAGSKQLVITYVPANFEPPIQCVITLNKQDEVRKIKTEMKELLDIDTVWPLQVAEGLDHHIAKILDDEYVIKGINTVTRRVYVLEQIVLDSDDIDDANSSKSSSVSSNKTPVCVICLEERESDIFGHRDCNCVLCKQCVRQSRNHYGGDEFDCPVCRTALKIDINLVRIEDESHTINTGFCRMLDIPVVYRVDEENDDCRKSAKLFGSPNILKLPSQVSNQKLYELIRRRNSPYKQNFKLLLVNGRGIRCARCMYTERCQGCTIRESGRTLLRKDDALAVSFSEPVVEIPFTYHSSISSFRTVRDVALTLDDCIQKYFESEFLDIPWFCGRCNEKRLAARTYTIRRFPKYLMVQLKRFHMSNNCVSTKLEDRVKFPLRDFSFTHGTKWSPHYDLYACVCHSGSLTGGHYIAYTQHPVNGKWHCFNDETVTSQRPLEDDATAYILFYKKRDSSGTEDQNNGAD